MPGFKNAHAHSGMTFLISYADDLPNFKLAKSTSFS
jgi:cytosine/adenosine deaminase-related metal-dependent hydrolase